VSAAQVKTSVLAVAAVLSLLLITSGAWWLSGVYGAWFRIEVYHRGGALRRSKYIIGPAYEEALELEQAAGR
jgi:hypothetical protein